MVPPLSPCLRQALGWPPELYQLLPHNEIAVFFNRYDYRRPYLVLWVISTYSDDRYRPEDVLTTVAGNRARVLEASGNEQDG